MTTNAQKIQKRLDEASKYLGMANQASGLIGGILRLIPKRKKWKRRAKIAEALLRDLLAAGEFNSEREREVVETLAFGNALDDRRRS